jgi:hypothetical protein
MPVHVFGLIDAAQATWDSKVVHFEYRLICSGWLFNAALQGDPRKSSAGWVLLDEPFALLACAESFDRYPQEIALRFRCGRVTEETKTAVGAVALTENFTPDSEIASDVAALLSLYTQRLVTVADKCRELHGDEPGVPDIVRDLPFALSRNSGVAVHPLRPLTVITRFDGQQVHDPNPAPLGVSPRELGSFLRNAAGAAERETWLRSVRLYALAWEYLHRDPLAAYQTLVISLETLAGTVLYGWKPEPPQVRASYEDLWAKAKSQGLTDDQAGDIVDIAARKERWIRRKFVTFVERYLPDGFWKQPPEPLADWADYLPKRDQLRAALNAIYEARSRFVHRGESLPDSIVVGLKDRVPARVMADVMGWMGGKREAVPPLLWFGHLAREVLVSYVSASADAAE